MNGTFWMRGRIAAVENADVGQTDRPCSVGGDCVLGRSHVEARENVCLICARAGASGSIRMGYQHASQERSRKEG